MVETNEKVRAYYEQNDEKNRLSNCWGQLEFGRSKEIIERHLPGPPGVVIDVGGAAGRYSCWLAQEGYEVHLVDPVSTLVQQARDASQKQPGHAICSFTVGDARQLDFSDEFADVVLMLGPLYHLTTRTDRLTAWRETIRTLKGGGVLFAVGISRFAPALDGLRRGTFFDSEFMRIIEQDLKDGQHRNHTDNPMYFTDAYLHRPEELQEEATEAGFNHVETTAVEGLAYMLQNLESNWNDAEKRRSMLQVIRLLEREPTVLGASSHLMCVARKPTKSRD